MNYTLLIYTSPGERALRDNPATQEEYRARYPAYARKLAEAGIMVGGAGLQFPETATTVKIRNDKRLVQDGPYADTKEQLGGYFIINVPDLDTALEWAKRMPCERDSAVEVRACLPPRAPAADDMATPPVEQAGIHYAILIYESANDFAARKDPQRQQAYWAQWPPYTRVLKEAGVFVGGAGLEPPDVAATLKLRDGQRLVHDGPFAETKEQLGGLFIINAANLDAALEWAARCPTVPSGVIEVRPVLKMA